MKYITLFTLFFLLSFNALAKGSETGLSYDLGYSIGSTNGEDYSEFNLGLNYQMTSWLLWRNALFSRNFSNELLEDSYGLDTSARVTIDLEIDQSSELRLFGGPGWRFASEGESPPFAEGGLSLRLGGLRVGASAKVIFNEVMDKDIPNDTQYTVNLSGSGRL